jgi:hypothetical protein
MSSGFGLDGRVSRCFYDYQEFVKCLVSEFSGSLLVFCVLCLVL